MADHVDLPEPRIVSSGCGAQFDPAPQFSSQAPLDSSLRVMASELVALMAQLT
ncbi:MAG: hypothetical protein Q8R28_22480 [Dehalococcoidia bacterium]|nr:hypothetical protein [Dehalococcoidia bacterium]